MSFVHCPSCHRAYDLRRAASCPACQRSEAAKPAASVEGELGERIAAMVEELAALVARASNGELEAARRTLDRRGRRALWGAPAVGGSRLLAAGERLVAGAIDAARRVSGDAAKRAASGDSEPPRQGARRLVRRLRDAWAGSPRA